MGQVFFTSDPHFFHRYVANLRGFRDVDEHNETLARTWRKAILPGDQVWLLGDLAVSSPDAALEFLDTLPGEKHLVTGNHDKCHPMHRDAFKHQAKYLQVFKSVQPFARRRIDGREVLLSHFPYEADRGQPRFLQYRLRNEGRFLLHGHTHSRDKVTGPREIHVGVDAWGMHPVPLATITELIRAQLFIEEEDVAA